MCCIFDQTKGRIGFEPEKAGYLDPVSTYGFGEQGLVISLGQRIPASCLYCHLSRQVFADGKRLSCYRSMLFAEPSAHSALHGLF